MIEVEKTFLRDLEKCRLRYGKLKAAAIAVRRLQREYFKHRTPEALIAAKIAEKILDELISEESET